MEAQILIKFFLCLIPLLILWLISVWLAKYKTIMIWNQKNHFLKRIETLNLDATHSLHLIRVDEEKVILLSVSPNETNILMKTQFEDLKPIKQNINETIQETDLISRLKTLMQGEK